ncbi:hypothetical protein D3C78_1281690 [compost metagenome]
MNLLHKMQYVQQTQNFLLLSSDSLPLLHFECYLTHKYESNAVQLHRPCSRVEQSRDACHHLLTRSQDYLCGKSQCSKSELRSYFFHLYGYNVKRHQYVDLQNSFFHQKIDTDFQHTEPELNPLAFRLDLHNDADLKQLNLYH